MGGGGFPVGRRLRQEAISMREDREPRRSSFFARFEITQRHSAIIEAFLHREFGPKETATSQAIREAPASV